MISPPRPDQAYPGRLPSVYRQWTHLSPVTRVVLVAVPVIVLVGVIAVNPAAGATIAVLVVGVAAATAVYVKNRTDRHNAAVDRGEITVVADPGFADVDRTALPAEVLDRLGLDRMEAGDVGRVRRFDTRFFTADASAIAHRVDGVIHADAELVELVWVEIGSKPLADLHPMTKNVLGELEKRLASGPLRHDADVPFFHFYGGKMQKDIMPGLV